MKKTISMVFAILLMLSFVVATQPVDNGNPGAIWTTDKCGGGAQDVNHYAIGDVVYVNGAGFAAGTYAWAITGGKGGSSCDPNVVVATANHATNPDGTFCFAAYTVAADDCGVYKVDYNDKNDNYTVENPSIPEFGVVAGAVALVGALGIFLFRRK